MAPGGAGGDCLNDIILRAIGRPASLSGSGATRVMFCRATFCHPELDDHEFRRDLLSMSVNLFLCLAFGSSLCSTSDLLSVGHGFESRPGTTA